MGGDLRAFFQTKCTHSSVHLLSPPISVCKKARLQSWHYSRDKRSEAADSCQINDCLPACFLSPPLVEGYWVIAIYLSPWCPPTPPPSSKLQKKLMVSRAGSCEGSPCLFLTVENGAWSRPRSRVINNLTRRRKRRRRSGEKVTEAEERRWSRK